MKKFYLLIILSVVFLGAFAQNSAESLSIKKHIVGIDNQHKSKTILSKAVILSEDFETAALPTGWTKVDGACGWLFGANGSSDYWTIPTHTNYAYANDDLCGSGGDMADVWLITPSMDLTTASGLILEFASFAGSDILTIKTSIDGGTNWNDLTAVAENTAWTTESIDLSSVEGEADVKIAFHFNDDGSWGYGWAIDDVIVYTLEAVEAGVTNITPTIIFAGESAYPEVTIKNLGASTIDIFDITVVINDGTSDVYTSTLNVTAAGQLSLTSAIYTMSDEWTTPAIGNYTITATLSLTDDANALNNTMTINTEVRVIGLGDVVAYFPAHAAGCPGVETDGTNIYTAYWGSGNFDKYDMNGSYISTFTVAGASNLRDMAYDGQYFYGSAGTTSLFQMDLANATLISTITAPVAVRAIAYDDDNNTLWANNWDTDLTEFLLSGIATGNSFASPSIYGAAYDNWSDPLNPTMWLFIGTGADTQTALVEYRLDGTATGRSIDVSAFPGFTAGAGSGSGGLASYEEDGIAYLLVNVQQDPNMIYKVFLFQALPLEEPQVVSYLPENSATNVAVDAVISATFDVDITAVDLTGITITPNPGSVSASITGDVLTIAHGDLAFNTIYTVLVPAGAVSAGTVNLASNIQWSFTTVDPVGIDVNKIAAISVYPNPANNVISVANAENKDIVVLNILGKVVAAVSSATSHQTINISNLSAGIYFVKVNTEVFKINVIK